MTHTYVQPCYKSSTFLSLQLKTLLGQDVTNLWIPFLKTTKKIEFRWVGSKLVHSMIVEGKKEFS